MPSCCTGVLAAACTQGKRTKHGKPQGVVSDDQPEAREGQAGRPGVAERFVVPLKPGNAGGGKGPQFKTNAIRGEGAGDWATYQLRRVFRSCRRRCTRKRRQKPGIASTPCTTRSAARIFWRMPMPSAALTRARRGWMVRTSRTSTRTGGEKMSMLSFYQTGPPPSKVLTKASFVPTPALATGFALVAESLLAVRSHRVIDALFVFALVILPMIAFIALLFLLSSADPTTATAGAVDGTDMLILPP